MNPVQRLHEAFVVMHQHGAARSCASTFILNSSFRVNGLDARLSIIAAISSMGGEHAPIVRTQLLLQEVLDNHKQIPSIVSRYNKKNRIPGFGSGFVKGEPDPIHADIDALIKELSPKTHYYMTELQIEVQSSIDDRLHMNTAMYSAATGVLLNISPYVLPGTAIEARMPIWNRIMAGVITELNNKP
jgi:citrate synthase